MLRLETRSTLYTQNSGENTKCPTQDVIDFAMKTVSESCHIHLLFSNNIVSDCRISQ